MSLSVVFLLVGALCLAGGLYLRTQLQAGYLSRSERGRVWWVLALGVVFVLVGNYLLVSGR